MPAAIPFPQSAARHERRRILNDTSIQSLKPPAKGRVDYFDDATPGLSLRMTSNDVRTLDGLLPRQERPPKAADGGPLSGGEACRRQGTRARSAAEGRARGRSRRRQACRARRPHVWRAGEGVHRRLRQAEQAELAGGRAPAQRELAAEMEDASRRRDLHTEDLLAVLNAKVKEGAPVAANRLRAPVSRMFTFAARRVDREPRDRRQETDQGNDARSCAHRRQDRRCLPIRQARTERARAEPGPPRASSRRRSGVREAPARPGERIVDEALADSLMGFYH